MLRWGINGPLERASETGAENEAIATSNSAGHEDFMTSGIVTDLLAKGLPPMTLRGARGNAG
jgi:hypothetical protein